MIVPAPDLVLISDRGPHWAGGRDPYDEPGVECDACGCVVEWLPYVQQFVEVDAGDWPEHRCPRQP